MKKGAWNKRSGGFTVVELLAVVAIMVILMGIAMVSVFRYRDLLKITELDNAAREIYMAAENRAVLLSGSRRLNYQVGQAGKAAALSDRPENSRAYFVSKADVNKTSELLTVGSVDPALMDGDFYIVYDLNGGSVTDVFYAESSMDGLVGSDFPAFYEKWAKDRSARLGLKNEMLVGYYNGQAAQGEDLDVLNGIDIHVLIENKEELTVTVEYTLPESGMSAELSVKLGSIDLMNTSGRRISSVMTDTKYSYTWVLDSLEKTDEDGKVTPAKQFKDLKSGIDPGGDFTVEATVTSPDGSFATSTARDDDNSLFREKSSGDIAYIKYLRHLQNLDTGFSGVTGKTAAVQDFDADILCTGNETYGDYDFIPIINTKLKSYDGQERIIRGLYVSGTKAPERDAGLFSKTTGGTSGTGMTFENIRLSNASVNAAEGKNAGALVGSTSDSTIKNCWVYWEPYGELTDLRTKLGSDAEGEEYHYQIIGMNAGGLVGHVQGNCTITGSLAATLVEGTSCAGGLVGQFTGSALTVSNSYADCYLKGGTNAAGLVGEMAAGNATLTDCYAAGYITGGTTGAGLCAGTGSTTATNVYSVMRFLNSGEGVTIYDLAQNLESSTNTHFLGSGTYSLSYETMVSDEFIATMGESTFARKTGNSHPYNLRDRLTLTIYSYPGLKDLPHYGDWTAQFKEPSLVYYEQYSQQGADGKTITTWGVSGGNARDLVPRSTLNNDRDIVSDGYGVAFLTTQEEIAALGDNDTITVQYTYWDGEKLAEWKEPEPYKKKDLQETQWKNEDGNSAAYYLIPLPEPMVDSDYAENCFYRYLSFKLVIGDVPTASGEYFYNPHFAETVSPIVSEGEGAVTWNEEELKKDPNKARQTLTAEAEKLRDAMSEVKIRTPRHLYDLSAFEQYYNRKYTFHQILDLDYSTYSGYDKKFQAKKEDVKSYSQKPIGSLSKPFSGTYNGGCNKIMWVIPEKMSGDPYGGLFGYSKGTLRDMVYEMRPEETVEISLGNVAQNLYVGPLVGGNEGTIRNCAVYGINLRAAASGVTLYVGGLAGHNTNSGTIRNCAAEFADLSADCLAYASVYVGGLVGQNAYGCTVSNSYAVGRISAVVAKTVPIARVCGFVGWNFGVITNCYAAADLQASGEHAELYGFCGDKDSGSQSNIHYLNKGNFIYRDVSYAADYLRKDDTADEHRAKTYGQMTENGMAGSLGMEWLWTGDQPDPDKQFPYPAIIKDARGNTVHYGDWPKPLPMGAMGVFYWEKMVNASDGESDPTYHLSSLAVNTEGEEKTITKYSTLSEAHDDGRVIVDYGYGYYARKDVDGEENEDGTKDDDKMVVQFSTENIGYTEFRGYTGKRYPGDNSTGSQRLPCENLDPSKIHPGSFTGATIEGRPNDMTQKQYEDLLLASDQASEAKEENAEKALAELMPEYTFHCWNSYHEGFRKTSSGYSDRVKYTTSGLYLFKVDANKNYQYVNAHDGSFTLSQGAAVKVEFCINPQFADSMSVKTKDITLEGGATAVLPGTTSDNPLLPGTTSDNPFQVRCGLQLQDINWYTTAFTDVPVDNNPYKADGFPYLSNDNNKRDYYWEQTHDIDWTAEGNRITENGKETAGVFLAIAQTKDNGKEAVPGWFGGTYDGQNYTIKNLNIGINTKNYEVNSMGLFGVVKNGELKNISMFSEKGTDTVTVLGINKASAGKDSDEKRTNYRNSAPVSWYAGGVLAGVALDSNISNCAVAGYEIVDKTVRTACSYETYKKTQPNTYTVGGAIGGLVGMTNGKLENCTSTAKIVIACDHKNDLANTTRNESAVPVHVGGLVGSTSFSVTDDTPYSVKNCYTGGSIDTSGASNASIYAGQIIGGVGIEPVDSSSGGAKVKVSNCYSYTEMPTEGDVVKVSVAIGSKGRTANNSGTVDLSKNYYLTGSVAKANGQTGVTYLQLANKENIDGQTIYEALGGGYDEVTSVSGGLEVSGRYSYAPNDRKDLVGMDYPFPTVLTMDGNHVHYGAWELYGIYRPEDGGQPVELDMFTKVSAEVKLKLSAGIVGGTWSVDGATVTNAEGETVTVATGKFNGTGTETTLTVEAKKAWSTPVTLTVHCKGTDKGDFELPIKVYVTDELELRPTTAKLFPGDTISLTLSAWGFTKTDGGTTETKVTDGILTVEDTIDSPLTATQGAPNGAVELTRSYETVSDAIRYLDLPYEFESVGKYSVNRTHRLMVELPPLPEATWTRDDTAGTWTWTMDFKDWSVKEFEPKLWENAGSVFKIGYTDTAVTVTVGLADVGKLTEDSVLTISFTLDGTAHSLKVPLSDPTTASVSVAAGPANVEGAAG